MKNKRVNVIGVIVTILITLGFIWAAVQWHNRHNWPPGLSSRDIQVNELRAFKNLELIGRAQEKYKETDWDKDGKKTYARFFVHLWTAVDSENEPVLIELIPRKLAFAMEASNAVGGYYFIDLHNRELPEQGQRRLDYERDWAIAAVPAAYDRSGRLTFLADNSGVIFTRNSKYTPSQYPHNPPAEGWSEWGRSPRAHPFIP